ncbi:hypothetical protein RP20_CCG013072 [Aedes albopictus]|nr:uncharacterized protein LOC115268716 [Aedes albopictus]KXJ74724.1 hypothetical protein RP20_CCG013072 [Aedes albopictus]
MANPQFSNLLVASVASPSTMVVSFSIGVLFFIASIGGQFTSSTLNCTACFSKTSWDDCRGQSFALPCSIVQVNDIHEGLVEFNPSLKPLPESTANVSFQCFSVELKSVGAPTGDFDRGFVSGCTFKQQKFCEEWIDEVQIERCDTCESEDICSLNEEEGEVEGGEEEQQNNGTGSGNRLRISIFLLGLMMFVDVFWRCS